jgi:nucleotide-binding universal stress UspA family protein
MSTSGKTGGATPILFAYDGSDQAQSAIREAGRQLSNGRTAIVLSVWQPASLLPFGGSGDAAPELEERFEAEAWETARQGAAAAAGFDATPLAESGSPVWRAIVESAEAHDAGVVVMGSHGRTGIAYVLMGSVADAVARHTDRPVLIVHRPAG